MDFRYSNGIIYIGEFECSIGEFLQYEPDFKLPDCEHLYYKKNELSAIIKNGNQCGDDSYNWKELDKYISKANIYITAQEAAKPVYIETYIDKRVAGYGSSSEQLEFLVENGIQALIDRNLAIKLKYPK